MRPKPPPFNFFSPIPHRPLHADLVPSAHQPPMLTFNKKSDPYGHKSPKPLQQFRRLGRRTGTYNRLPPSKGHMGGLEEEEGSGTSDNGSRSFWRNFWWREGLGAGESLGSVDGLGDEEVRWEERRVRLEGEKLTVALLARVEGGEELGFWVHGAWGGRWLWDGFR
ncbi:hypothetical protein Pyn_15528 [Prunus yedoensis var. nudiflora]|uniref:Uncharacterized protein n=1 Tax=Prunus yedoensis var. nudiflora TaxID=2094558 RepID=A0A314ULT4_PRUYE|nr:hypothetical protein Pyn_15528 [Prunus yedoensis var. nudiflora]